MKTTLLTIALALAVVSGYEACRGNWIWFSGCGAIAIAGVVVAVKWEEE